MISQVFQEFLDEQKARLKPKAFAKYNEIISLFKSYLDQRSLLDQEDRTGETLAGTADDVRQGGRPSASLQQVTQICGEMWDISGVVVKTSRGWRFLEVWNVSP
jgi:hypothetical protein